VFKIVVKPLIEVRMEVSMKVNTETGIGVGL